MLLPRSPASLAVGSDAFLNPRKLRMKEDKGLPKCGDELVRSAISAEQGLAISESKRKPRRNCGEEVIVI
jgi:hypothetical protein